MGKDKIDYSIYPESDVIVNHTLKRFKKGLGTNIWVIGLPGTGKSSVCIRLGELISEGLHQENRITKDNIIDSLLKLLEFVKNAEEPGEIMIVEEVSVLFSSRRSLASDNVAMARVMDTIRKKQIIVLANAPLLKSMDSHMRCLGHILIETLRINRKQGVVISKPLRLQTNPRSGKTYFHRLLREGKEVHRTYTKMPDSELWKEYEEKKDEFMEDLYEREKKRAEKREEKIDKELGIKKRKRIVKALTKRELQVHQLLNVKKLRQTDVAKELGLSDVRISNIVKNINKKANMSKESGDFVIKI